VRLETYIDLLLRKRCETKIRLYDALQKSASDFYGASLPGALIPGRALMQIQDLCSYHVAHFFANLNKPLQRTRPRSA